MNKVDQLQEEIKNIQDSCTHSYDMIAMPILLESNVSGVYIGTCEGGQAELTQNPNPRNFNPRFILQCTQCSSKRQCNIIGTCPMCYGVMKTDHYLQSREKYYGVSYLYFMAKLHWCGVCKFRAVTEEFDQ